MERLLNESLKPVKSLTKLGIEIGKRLIFEELTRVGRPLSKGQGEKFLRSVLVRK